MKRKPIEKLMHRKGDEDGFTIMETIIVLMIILILSASVGFVYFRYIASAKSASAKTQIETFNLALAQYFMDVGDYPSESEGLAALRDKPSSENAAKKWNGPYLQKKVPKDPWGNEYVYKRPAPDGSEFGIASWGADGVEGGTGKDADIATWIGEE
jgi:general secretion pathway protein G